MNKNFITNPDCAVLFHYFPISLSLSLFLNILFSDRNQELLIPPFSTHISNIKHLLSTRIHVLKSSMMFYLFRKRKPSDVFGVRWRKIKKEHNPYFYFEARFPIERPKTTISGGLQLNRSSCVDIWRPLFQQFHRNLLDSRQWNQCSDVVDRKQLQCFRTLGRKKGQKFFYGMILFNTCKKRVNYPKSPFHVFGSSHRKRERKRKGSNGQHRSLSVYQKTLIKLLTLESPS